MTKAEQMINEYKNHYKKSYTNKLVVKRKYPKKIVGAINYTLIGIVGLSFVIGYGLGRIGRK